MLVHLAEANQTRKAQVTKKQKRLTLNIIQLLNIGYYYYWEKHNI